MTLTEFLLARIAEDEKAATHRDLVTFGAERRKVANAALRDPHDPARVLAECEAKRRIVSLHPDMLEWCQGCAHESYPCRTLLALALPYADHPDYREEWRP